MAKGKFVKSVGTNVAGSSAGRRLIRKQLTDAGLDTSKKNMDEYAVKLAADIDGKVIQKTT